MPMQDIQRLITTDRSTLTDLVLTATSQLPDWEINLLFEHESNVE